MKKFAYLLVAVAALALIVGPAIANAQAPKPPTTVILKGNPMGGVKFDHAAHAKVVVDKCDTCHHASKPEKATRPSRRSASRATRRKPPRR
jgi:cytochrome c5